MVTGKPQVVITDPSAGSDFPQGQPVLFEATVSYEGDLASLTHVWQSGNIEMCANAVVEGSTIQCTYGFDDLGPQTVQVTVGGGTSVEPAQAFVDINVIVNEPPTIEIVAPLSGENFRPTDTVNLSAVVDDLEDPPENLTVSVASDIDGILATTGAVVSSGDWSSPIKLSKGVHQLTYTVTDTGGRTGQDVVENVIINTPPGPCVVEIDPAQPLSGQGMVARLTTPSVDSDGDGVSYTYAWWLTAQGQSPVLSGSGPNIGVNQTVRDDFWEVIVTPVDDAGATGPVCKDSVVIANSPPKIDSVVINPTNADTTNDIVATANLWQDADGDPERYTYQWYKNGTLDPAEQTIGYPANKTERGDEIMVVVTPRDDFDTGVPKSSNTITIDNAPPTQPGVSIAPQNPGTDDILTCSVTVASIDPDPGDSVNYRYQWYLNGNPYGDTDSTIDSTQTTLGDTWECRVTASDGTDDSPFGKAIVAIIDNAPPDAPVFDPIDAYRNEDYVDFTGDCEPGTTVTFYCEDTLPSQWTETTSCTNTADFAHTVTLTRGETTSCYATLTDQFNNESSPSTIVDTEACTTVDTYEIGTAGDSGAFAIDQWAQMYDDGTSINIVGTVPSAGDADWYVIQTGDNTADDKLNNINYYRFQVKVTQGTAYYTVMVHQGGYSNNDAECPTQIGVGYDEYEDYAYDDGTDAGASHSAPLDSRECGAANSPIHNECESLANTYYIQVIRDSSLPFSCDPYELTISNGVWP